MLITALASLAVVFALLLVIAARYRREAEMWWQKYLDASERAQAAHRDYMSLQRRVGRSP